MRFALAAFVIITQRCFIKVFGLLGFSEAYVEEKFGAMLGAFKYGAPPHAGCAFGVDRILMELIDEQNVRETLAFQRMALVWM